MAASALLDEPATDEPATGATQQAATPPERRKPRYNPLLLHGRPGTGKSHLARGLAEAWRRCRPGDSIAVVTAAEFAEQYADAVENRDVDAWHARYRRLALLVLEDLGQIVSKAAAQIELTHTLDVLCSEQAQVIVTSRLAPAELPGLLPALASRLSAGLDVRLAPPGHAARYALLHQFAAQRRIPLAEPAARLLAAALAVTAPELMGVLFELQAAMNDPAAAGTAQIDARLARRLVAARGGTRQPTLRGIAAQTAKCFALRVDQLRSASRRRGVVLARDVAMYLARHLTGQSLDQIGQYFGGRDHTTVQHGCRKIGRLMESDPDTRQAVLELRQTLAPTA